MPASMEEIGAILSSDSWTDGEKFVVKWQFGLLGDFYAALAKAISLADEDNLCCLELGFPEEVEGFRRWALGDLGRRLRAEGLRI